MQHARMAALDAQFEKNLRESVMDDAEAKLYGQGDNLAFAYLQFANENLRDYGREQDMDGMDNIAETGKVTDTRRSRNRVEATLEWDPPSAIFEFGSPPHIIRGNPVLSFIWEDPPQWVKQSFKREGDGWRVFFGSVNHPGVPASRYLRNAIRRWGLEVQRGITL